MMDPDEALRRLVRWFGVRAGGVVVAFSGGVDSTLVAMAAHKALKDSAVAVTVKTDFMTQGEIEEAASAAEGIGIEHRVLRLTLPEEVKANLPDRCYRCKSLILRALKEYAEGRGGMTVVDGTNSDDLRLRRPGLRALREEGVSSPLAEMGLGKADVRAISKVLGLDHDKPSSPCLATRFPIGSAIEPRELEAVAEAEEFIRGLGFLEVRVRARGWMAKIEVGKGELERMMGKGTYRRVASRLRRMGFKEVALDLEGYVPEAEREGRPNGRKERD